MNTDVFKTISVKSIGLSGRVSNCLQRAGIKTLDDLMQQDEKSIRDIRNLGEKSVNDILFKISEYKPYWNKGELPADLKTVETKNASEENPVTSSTKVKGLRNVIDDMLTFVRKNDIEINNTDLSARTKSKLFLNNLKLLSEVLFLSKWQLLRIPYLGGTSADEIISFQKKYFETNEKKFKAFCAGEVEDISPNDNNSDGQQVNEDILKTTSVESIGLSVRATNALQRAGIKTVDDLIKQTEDSLLSIRNLPIVSSPKLLIL